MTRHHEANITRHGGISLATQVYALYQQQELSISQITVRLYGEDTVHGRKQVNSLIDEARRNAARSH
ncbi:hypothetical protein [Aureimonas sp. AU20]|uniref:hypothetical protein n=1 Tax=Aureimonas sp. AU20 TaxID=1349819 RepID=UPI000721890D|nr:hypothetical protein [Aureimonas sp. AU20]ALN73555.1 hypothetical protein M673_12580 [Aureimonas sp. AU20]